MREILADLVAEQQALDQLLQRAPDRDWKTKTPAAGWTVHDTISHLAWTEEHAKRAVHDDESISTDLAAYGSVDAFNQGKHPGQPPCAAGHFYSRAPRAICYQLANKLCFDCFYDIHMASVVGQRCQ